MGVFSHTIARCNRPGLLSWSSCRGAAGASDGVSQYGLALANDRSAAPLDDCRSAIAPVTDIFSSAPTCSWDALIVRRNLRANQTTAARMAPSIKRFPSAYQLLCIQVDNSFMASPCFASACSPARLCKAPSPAHQFTRFRSFADRVSLNTPTHTFQPNVFNVLFYKLFVFNNLVAVSHPATRLHYYASEDQPPHSQ